MIYPLMVQKMVIITLPSAVRTVLMMLALGLMLSAIVNPFEHFSMQPVPSGLVYKVYSLS